MNKTMLAAVAACAAGVASAETNETLRAELPPVIVEASRTGRTAGEIPAAVRVIGRDEIAASGARDLTTLVERRTSSLNVTRMGAGCPALDEISIRGWGESGFGRTLVMLDGRRLNFADRSVPLLSQIDLGAVERVEILHGSQCVLHGDAASAGAINIVTDPGGYERRARVEAHAGSWDTYGAGASIRGGYEEERVRYWGYGSWEHSDGFRSNNGWETWNASGGVRKDWKNGSYLRVSAFYNDSLYDLPGTLPRETWKLRRTASSSLGDWYRRGSSGANATLEAEVMDELRLRIDATLSRTTMHTRNPYSGSYTDYDPNNFWAPTDVSYFGDYRMHYDIWAFEATPQLVCTANQLGLEGELVAGTFFRYDRLHGMNRDSVAYRPDFWGMTGTGRTKYEYNREAMAFFAEETLHLSKEVAVEVGGRYQRTWDENTALLRPRRVSDMYAADAALLFAPVEGLKTFVRTSRFFRSPFLDEIPYKDMKAQNLLRPERGWSVDVGLDWTFLGEFNVFMDAFASKTKDEILYDIFTWNNNVNAPCDILREGFTAGASWERAKVAGLNLAYTYVEAKFDGGAYDGRDVPMVPESTFSATGRVWLWDELFAFGGWRYVSSRYSYSDFRNAGSGLSSFGVFHLGLQYEPEWKALRGLRLGVAIDNLLDRRYADCAGMGGAGNEGYYPAAGRSVMFTVSYEF